ncbi:MAG: hypothetical protein AAGC55_31205, partial [Myxococcota bacterium]
MRNLMRNRKLLGSGGFLLAALVLAVCAVATLRSDTSVASFQVLDELKSPYSTTSAPAETLRSDATVTSLRILDEPKIPKDMGVSKTLSVTREPAELSMISTASDACPLDCDNCVQVVA